MTGSDYSEEKFQEHIKAMVEESELDHSIGERPLTLSELKELAISMGLTEEQWVNLQEKAKVHLKLADDHLKARNFTEAIAEAERATAINPYIPNGNAVLARAYLMKWLETHDDQFKERAAYYAKKELLVDPKDQDAVNVLSTIERKSNVLEKDNKTRNTILIAVGAVVLLLILGIILFKKADSDKADELEQEQNQIEYNNIRDQLIEAEEEVNSKWDLVQIAIDQRNSMIPDLFKAVQTSDKDLDDLNTTIEELQNKIKSAEGQERFDLENSLDAKIKEAREIVRERGDAENVERLIIQIEGSENRIAYEKKNYNDAVKEYNILVKKNKDKFPEYEVKPYFSSQ